MPIRGGRLATVAAVDAPTPDDALVPAPSRGAVPGAGPAARSGHGGTLRVIIVDAGVESTEHLRNLLSGDGGIDIVAACRDGWDAVRAIRDLEPTLVILDVDLPRLNGFEVLEAVGSVHLPSVVFVTDEARHALRAFEARASDFLLKPCRPERLEQALERVRGELGGAMPHALLRRLSGLAPNRYLNRIVVRQGVRLVFLRMEDVDWVEASGNYLRVHAGGACHPLRATMNALERQLDPEEFLRIHRSAIVNLDRVAEMRSRLHGDYSVVLNDGQELTMSVSYRDRLVELRGRSR